MYQAIHQELGMIHRDFTSFTCWAHAHDITQKHGIRRMGIYTGGFLGISLPIINKGKLCAPDKARFSNYKHIQ